MGYYFLHFPLVLVLGCCLDQEKRSGLLGLGLSQRHQVVDFGLLGLSGQVLHQG